MKRKMILVAVILAIVLWIITDAEATTYTTVGDFIRLGEVSINQDAVSAKALSSAAQVQKGDTVYFKCKHLRDLLIDGVRQAFVSEKHIVCRRVKEVYGPALADFE